MEKLSWTTIDGYCGAGGLSLGFEWAGFKPIFAYDNDAKAIASFRDNFGAAAYPVDASGLTKSSIEEILGYPLPSIDVFIGGPPCQGFSVQRRGEDVDPRNDLVNHFVELVLEIRPSFVLMENVSGLLSKRGKPALSRARRLLAEAGYLVVIGKLNAMDFGVPQDRRRVFLVAEKCELLNCRFEFPKPTVSPENRKTVRDAIEDLASVPLGTFPNHIADRLSETNLERIRSLKAGDGRDKLPEHLVIDSHRKHKAHRHLDVYGRMAWDRPSPTITARFDSFSRGRFGHPVLDRSISLREGARLQGFPDDFVFHGSKVEVARQIGNSVPPPLAMALAMQIRKALDG